MSENGRKTMKAIIFTRYGPPEVLQFKEVEKPVPNENEILVKVHATTVTAADIRVRGFNVQLWYWLQARMYLGLRSPTRAVLGAELAGEVESVGSGVAMFKVGDQIFASVGHEFRAFAEYRCLPEDCIVATKPSNLAFEEAATIPLGGLTALHFLRMGGIQGGQKVLIYGASGSVGAYAVQLAKYFGAEVIGVCSGSNADLVESLGASEVIDYTKEDLARRNESYDLVLDAVGKISRSRGRAALKENGKYLSVLTSGVAKLSVENLVLLGDLAEKGKLHPVVDRIYPWEQIIEAHRYVDLRHKKGNVAIAVHHDENGETTPEGRA